MIISVCKLLSNAQKMYMKRDFTVSSFDLIDVVEVYVTCITDLAIKYSIK